MSATLTHRPEAPNSVSDHPQVSAPKKTGRWALVAAIVALAIGFVVTNNTVDDGSSSFAEAQRMQALAPVQSPDVSSQTAEFQRHLALADGAIVDSSFQHAEEQRMAALAGNVSGTEDNSHEFAEFQRMQALADNSWQVAEDRRFAALDPAGN
jgi:hypothetical protein